MSASTSVRPATSVASARLPTVAGEFQLHLYADPDLDRGNLALVLGDVAGRRDVLVRVHSECFTGETLGSLRCDCGPQLLDALERIAEEGAGVVIYLRQEGRGIGLAEKLRAYNLQDEGHDTVDANLLLGRGADERDYTAAAEILLGLGVASVRLLTNNPAKIESLERLGIPVAERVPTLLHLNAENTPYLAAKVERMRHLLDLDPTDVDALAAEVAEQAVATPSPEPRGLEALRRRLAAHRGPRPFVTLSYAQSVDGSIAATADRPLALSGDASLTLTHQLRALHDAILVGVGTVIADDPRLTVRRVAGTQPRPVVVDSRLRTPPDSSLFGGDGPPPLVVTVTDADRERERRLIDAGAEVVRLPAAADGRVALPALVAHLGALGLASVMVEGGAAIITSFLADRLVDHLVVTLAPVVVGGVHGVAALGDDGPLRLRRLEVQRLGEDLVLWADPEWPAADGHDAEREPARGETP